ASLVRRAWPDRPAREIRGPATRYRLALGCRGSRGQPLTLPAVRPARMLRWKIRKKIRVGTAAMAEAAMTRFTGVVWAAWVIPTLSVSRVGLYPPSTSSGHRKSFQTATTPKIDTTPRIGREIGST